MAAEPGDDLVEDQRATRLGGNFAHGMEKLARLQVRPAALDERQRRLEEVMAGAARME